MYFGGIPTKPDIIALNKKYPVESLTPGRIIKYDEIESVISCDKYSHRFRTVTTRWRDLIENGTGIRIGAFGGSHFQVLNDSEKLEFIIDKKRSMIRQTKRNLVRTNYVDRDNLSDEEKASLDHETNNAKKMLASQQIRDKNLKLPSI